MHTDAKYHYVGNLHFILKNLNLKLGYLQPYDICFCTHSRYYTCGLMTTFRVAASY
jgi:hypothetical protein